MLLKKAGHFIKGLNMELHDIAPSEQEADVQKVCHDDYVQALHHRLPKPALSVHCLHACKSAAGLQPAQGLVA